MIVSLSSQSVLRIWNAEDGSFIGECAELFGLLHLAVSMTMLQDKDTIVVCGTGQRAYFVSIGSKQVIAAIRAHRDWITHISTRSVEGEATEQDLARRHHSLLMGDTRTVEAFDRDCVTNAVAESLGEMPEFVTGSFDGTVAVWGARAFKDRSVAWEITPLLRLHLTRLVGRVEGAHKSLVCADISNDGGMLAVVTVKKWFLVSLAARGHPTVAAVRIPKSSSNNMAESEWAGGYFVSNTLFFCWSQFGVGFLYRIEMQKPAAQQMASPTTNNVPAPTNPSMNPSGNVREDDENIDIELEKSTAVSTTALTGSSSSSSSTSGRPRSEEVDYSTMFDNMRYTVRLLYCLDPPVFPADPQDKSSKSSGWRGSYSKGIFTVANGSNLASWVFPRITEAPILFGGRGIVMSNHVQMSTLPFGVEKSEAKELTISVPPVEISPDLASSPEQTIQVNNDEDDYSTMAQRRYKDQIEMYSVSKDVMKEAEIISPSAIGSFKTGFTGIRSHSGPNGYDVTCTCLLEDIMMLVCGFSNGEISARVFQGDWLIKGLKAHTKRVTNILAPSPDISKDCRYLITAGDDFCIKIWNLL